MMGAADITSNLPSQQVERLTLHRPKAFRLRHQHQHLPILVNRDLSSTDTLHNCTLLRIRWPVIPCTAPRQIGICEDELRVVFYYLCVPLPFLVVCHCELRCIASCNCPFNIVVVIDTIRVLRGRKRWSYYILKIIIVQTLSSVKHDRRLLSCTFRARVFQLVQETNQLFLCDPSP